MTLRADRLKSNYRTCWKFEMSSVPILVSFSILFFNFLKIYPLEFDTFHYIKSFWVVLDLGTLRLPRVWMYIWVFWKLDHSCGTKFWKFSWKNEFFQIDPESIWDGPWITRAWKNILNSLEASGIMKKHQIFENDDKLKNWSRKWRDTDSKIIISISFGFFWIVFTFLLNKHDS